LQPILFSNPDLTPGFFDDMIKTSNITHVSS